MGEGPLTQHRTAGKPGTLASCLAAIPCSSFVIWRCSAATLMCVSRSSWHIKSLPHKNLIGHMQTGAKSGVIMYGAEQVAVQIDIVCSSSHSDSGRRGEQHEYSRHLTAIQLFPQAHSAGRGVHLCSPHRAHACGRP